jgi:hypothetical protein
MIEILPQLEGSKVGREGVQGPIVGLDDFQGCKGVRQLVVGEG